MDLLTPGRVRFALAVPPAPLAGLIILAGAGICLALNLPGHMSDDSVVQLAQGRAGVYNSWHPPVMAWLLGLSDSVTPGTAVFVIFTVALIFGALLAFVLLARRFSWATALLAAACAASPLLLIYPAIVWKDVLFAAAAVAGFACLSHAARQWTRRPVRYALLAAALLLLTLAALARQNGAVVLPFGAAAVGWMATVSDGRARRGRAIGIAFLAAGVLGAAAATAALNTRSDGEPAIAEQWRDLQVFDITGVLALAPRTELTVLRARAPALERLVRTRGLAAYSPSRIDALSDLPELQDPAPGTDAVVAAQWREVIVHHPVLYLRARARAFAWVFLTPRIDQCLPIYVGIDGPKAEMMELALVRRMTDRDEALESYATGFQGTPVFSHVAYGVLALVLLLVLLRRRCPSDIAVAAMLASAMAFTATFVLISLSCDYRYLYYLDLAAMAAALYAVATRGA
jgi:hypothetical protein